MYRSLDISCTNVDTCISGLTTPPSWNSVWYRRVLPLTKTSLSSSNKKPDIQRYFIQPYHVYQGCLLYCHHIDYFRWISPIKVTNMTSCLLRSRDVKVTKSMLSFREFICAQSHKKISVISLQTKKLHSKECSGSISPICNIRVKRQRTIIIWV